MIKKILRWYEIRSIKKLINKAKKDREFFEQFGNYKWAAELTILIEYLTHALSVLEGKEDISELISYLNEYVENEKRKTLLLTSEG